jgi:hypothetical protein
VNDKLLALGEMLIAVKAKVKTYNYIKYTVLFKGIKPQRLDI